MEQCLQELRNRQEWQVRDAQRATWDVAQEILQEFVPGPALPRALRAAGSIHGGPAGADVPTLRCAEEGSRAASLAAKLALGAGGYQRGPLRPGRHLVLGGQLGNF